MRHKKGNKKLNKPYDQRMALLRGQVCSLFLSGHITTTNARASQVKRLAEKLITRARAGTLHDTREIMKVLYTKEAYLSLKHNVVPAVNHCENGGYLKEYKIGQRRGDGSAMVRLEVPGFSAE
ncbi:50S ribosomal protein L17 [bacterium]|nr:50S ribosomal protein L17 [bacterium]